MTTTNYPPFIPGDFSVTTWEAIEPYFQRLMDLPIDTENSLERFLTCKSELESAISDDGAWRYIRTNADTRNEQNRKAFEYYVDHIEPNVERWTNKLEKRLVEPTTARLMEKRHPNILRLVKNQLELFRDENLPILAELQKEEQEYGAIISEVTVEVEGRKLTLQQASDLLQENDRAFRETVYRKIQAERLARSTRLNELLSSLLRKRYRVAVQAGFRNFRDYQHQRLARFDYTVADLEVFHQAIADEVLPLVDSILEQRKAKLGVEHLKPWDLQGDPDSLPPLRPFTDPASLINSARACFNAVDPEFGRMFQGLHSNDLLDLESREGKAPGGFNYPLYGKGNSFIFMNAIGSMKDFEVIMHEGGHAFHTSLCSNLPLLDYKQVPAEVAELASMSMELIAMEHWHKVLSAPDDIRRAKRSLLEDCIVILPWIAAIDKFQHWLYTHPEHSHEERDQEWTRIYRQFSSPVINWEGVEEAFVFAWQRQLHVFEVPFYYIEYAMAQMGAIAIWREYRNDPSATIKRYKKALALGYTKPIPDIYREAGIEFSFNREYLKRLMAFVQGELGF